jgi:hypothetical protein
MPATLTQISTIRKDVDLKERVTAAIAKQSEYILNTELPNTPNHLNRRKWAMDALMAPEVFADRMLWMVSGNTSIQDAFIANGEQSDIPDGDIIYVVNISVDSFARGL